MPEMRLLAPHSQTSKAAIIWQITEICLGALFGALTVVGLMIVFLALCIVVRAIGFVLSADFDDTLKLPR